MRYLPSSGTPLIGNCRLLRYKRCKHIFLSCGKNVKIEQKAYIASWYNLVIGDNHGLGINCCIPQNTVIGENVMMGPNCYILAQNHDVSRTDIPMIQQGFIAPKQTVIKDDVWIGRDVLMTPGRIIEKGTIIAGGCVLCKDFPAFSIVGGNPSRLIKSRLYD